MKNLHVNYENGFTLPGKRSLIEFIEGDEDPVIGDRFLKKQGRMSIDTRKTGLIVSDTKPKTSLRHLQHKLESNQVLLDYGVAIALLKNFEFIPREWRKYRGITFCGCFLGWLHPYTGYVLEHVRIEVPILKVSSGSVEIILKNYPMPEYGEEWNYKDFPVAFYNKVK